MSAGEITLRRIEDPQFKHVDVYNKLTFLPFGDKLSDLTDLIVSYLFDLQSLVPNKLNLTVTFIEAGTDCGLISFDSPQSSPINDPTKAIKLLGEAHFSRKPNSHF